MPGGPSFLRGPIFAASGTKGTMIWQSGPSLARLRMARFRHVTDRPTAWLTRLPPACSNEQTIDRTDGDEERLKWGSGPPKLPLLPRAGGGDVEASNKACPCRLCRRLLWTGWLGAWACAGRGRRASCCSHGPSTQHWCGACVTDVGRDEVDRASRRGHAGRQERVP